MNNEDNGVCVHASGTRRKSDDSRHRIEVVYCRSTSRNIDRLTDIIKDSGTSENGVS